MKNKFFLTAGMVGMLSGVTFGATDGADKGWFSEYRPYMVLRGGWLFGKAEPGISLNIPPNTYNASAKKNLKSVWAGSIEFGTSHYEDRVFCGVELGYFTGKFNLSEPLDDAGSKIDGNGDIENFFATGNITLRHDSGERTFWYGGIGAGLVRRYCKVKSKVTIVPDVWNFSPVMWKWSFLGQAFTGIGVYLTDDWQLTAGYRLRWMPENFGWELEGTKVSIKQRILHAVEIGVVRQF